jgi:8-oxo-dGTP pyrophosphatase MutT (NUDIX family)
MQQPRCNNCGQLNHTFKQCRTPITSNGIIHYQDGKYLMICRKKTLGYVDLMRGKYVVKNGDYIKNLVDEMTLQEKADLLVKDFTDLSHDMWQSAHEDIYAREKFLQLKASGQLEALIASSRTTWTEQEWGFPKGRRNPQESEVSSAKREYEEETGFDRSKLELVENLAPYEEVFIGSNYKAYKHKYYLAFGDPVKIAEPQRSEVSNIGWFTLDEALEKIRPYNVERKTLLKRVDRTVNTFFRTN